MNVNKQHWEHTKKLVGRAHLVEVLGQLGGKLKLSKIFSSSFFANTILKNLYFSIVWEITKTSWHGSSSQESSS